MEKVKEEVKVAEKATMFELDYERFSKDYLYEFIVKNRLIIILWSLTAIIDAWSTTLFMQYTGPQAEYNNLTRGCAIMMGTEAGPYIAGILKLVLALPFLIMFKKGGGFILFFSMSGQIYAIIANIDLYITFKNVECLML